MYTLLKDCNSLKVLLLRLPINMYIIYMFLQVESFPIVFMQSLYAGLRGLRFVVLSIFLFCFYTEYECGFILYNSMCLTSLMVD